MLNVFDVGYDEISNGKSNELYRLRKKTFRDRLGWAVSCFNDMEYDEYDSSDARYILGVYQEKIVCSVRFIMMDRPNMITHTFNHCFGELELPRGHYIESSRFFVQKERAQQILGSHYPISHILMLSMINYSRYHHIDGIYTVVSSAMWNVIRRNGWQLEKVSKGYFTKEECIYLLFIPVGENNQFALAEKISQILSCIPSKLLSWPISLSVNARLVDQP
ncbi:acyl-homoserine-lactone synthase [Symbiopectobacterium purcellii]|uniref:acyl-homoserine-lactone synthase n=1 Tax=Symbiopectobacterium purcellii TaxID=2871826 RepID=UPI003F87D17A